MVTGAGVDIVEGPVSRPAADGSRGTSIYCRDPDGNLIELLTTDRAIGAVERTAPGSPAVGPPAG